MHFLIQKNARKPASVSSCHTAPPPLPRGLTGIHLTEPLKVVAVGVGTLASH